MSDPDRRKSEVASSWRFTRNNRSLSVSRSQLSLPAAAANSSAGSPLTFQATSALEQSNLDKYFEVLVDDIQGFVSIGLATVNHPLNVHVGRASSSWGFSTDNGSVWADGREIMLKFGPAIATPFVLGCGIANYQVFWTMNGQFLGFCHQIVPDTIISGLFATISVTASAFSIRYNADGIAERFLFELGLKKRQMALFLSIHTSRTNTVIPKERYSPAVAISGDVLIAYGGRGRFNQVYGDLIYFDFTQRRWETVEAEGADRPPKMYGHSGNCFTCLRAGNASSSPEQKSRRFFFMYGGRMLSLGTRWKESQSPWLLDIDTRVWSRPWLETASMPIGRYGHATAMSGLNFYVHGGFNSELNQALSDLHVLDVSRIDDAVQKHKFKEIVPHVNPLSITGSSSASVITASTSPTPRYGHSMVYFENKLYIYGGRYRQTFLGDLWEFNLETATWRQPVTNSITPSARYRHTANVVEGRYMVVVGGNHRAEVALNDIWVLDLRPNQKGELVWERLFTSIEPTYGHGACVCYGFSEKSFRFRTYSKWTADPPVDGSGALESPSRLSSKTFWDTGIVIFGGAAETGMNNHPRRLKNSIHWMLLQQLSPKIRPSGSAPDLFSNTIESSSESVNGDLITQTRTSRGQSFSVTASILSTSRDAESAASPTKANSSPLPLLSPNILSKSPQERQTTTGSTTAASLKKDAADPLQTQPQRSLTAPASSGSTEEQATDIAVKCYNGNDIRVLSILSTTKLSKLVRKIQKEYDEHAPVTLKYVDPEGDLVTLSKTADLKTAIWLHQSLKTPVLKIHVFVVDSRGSSALTASGSNQIVHASRPLPSISTQSPAAAAAVSSSGATPAVRSQSGGTISAQEALAAGYDPTLYLWHIPFSELEFKGSLGKGYFGEVKKALFRGAVVACKIIYRNAFRDKHEVDLFVQEVDLMSKLRHPKVISFLGASLDADDKVIVMEFMHNGSLYDALRHVDTREAVLGSPGTMLNIALDIAQGMSYLHSKHVLHRDLTSKNILLDKQFTAKVSDLGLSKMKEGVVQLSGTFGAIPWQAPEIISGDEFTESADVYSMGCILCELCTGVDLAGTGMSAVQMADKIRQGWRPEIAPTCPTAWRALIEECWDPNPEKRPSFEQIVALLEKLSSSPEFGGDGGDGASGCDGSEGDGSAVEFDGYDM